MKADLKFDGGSRGNPGPAASAAVLCLEDGRVLRRAVYIGSDKTNNEAEYSACQLGVDMAVENGVDDLRVFGDSKLVVCHVDGSWRCKSDQLKPLLGAILRNLAHIPKWSIQHVERNLNSEADQLVNQVLDLTSPRR